tara:strand:+ start:60 stop:356 length:297 start_codon:yes stop_codon:yes gene_type:complete
MSKLLIHITAQYSENRSTSDIPHWKQKGSQIFSLEADDEDFLYVKEQSIKAIGTLLAKHSNAMCNFEYVSHEIIFHNIIALDADLFQTELTKECQLSM